MPRHPPSRPATACSDRERLLLQRAELGFADRAAVEQLLRPRDLVGGAAPTGDALALVERHHLVPRPLLVPLRHPVVLRDEVDEDAEERQDDGEDDPAGLPPAREVVAPEDVAE